MSDSIDIRKAVKKAIDEALKQPVKGKSLGEVVEKAVERAIREERAKFGQEEKVQASSKRTPTAERRSSGPKRDSSDSLDKLFDAEVKSKYVN